MYLKSPTQKALTSALALSGPKSQHVQSRAQSLIDDVYTKFGSPELVYLNANSVRIFIQKGGNPLWLHLQGRTFMATRNRITQRTLVSSPQDQCMIRTEDSDQMKTWIRGYVNDR